MKRVIWKFPLEITSVQDIEIPHGAALLSVQVQNGVPMLWALIYDSAGEKETLRFRTICTGEEFNEDDFSVKDFMGTYQLAQGARVYHVFQVTL